MPEKIFISYTSSDREWAYWIGVTLRDAGYVPLVHEWEIPGGGHIARWMDEGLQAADRLLGVFTDAYTKALYSNSERWSAYWHDPDGREGFLVPVEVEQVRTWPPLTRPLKRLSLVGLSETQAEQALLAFLKKPEPPQDRPKFPGGVATDSGTTKPRQPASPKEKSRTAEIVADRVTEVRVVFQKTVFVSYRRADEQWALAIFQNLTQHGYDVFIDYDGIASGDFETAILENIKARAHFLVLLTPTAVGRLDEPGDWMRREIEAAIDSQRNIVPLMLKGFDFDKPAIATQLTGRLVALKRYNSLYLHEGYFSPAMERLRAKFLNVSLETVLYPASLSAKIAATEQRDKAAIALTVGEHINPADGLPIKRPVWPGKIPRQRRLIVGGLAALAAFFIISWCVVNLTHRTPLDCLLEIINGNGNKKQAAARAGPAARHCECQSR
jgi:hypothetical protein